jgi:hypothetical protein
VPSLVPDGAAVVGNNVTVRVGGKVDTKMGGLGKMGADGARVVTTVGTLTEGAAVAAVGNKKGAGVEGTGSAKGEGVEITATGIGEGACVATGMLGLGGMVVKLPLPSR